MPELETTTYQTKREEQSYPYVDICATKRSLIDLENTVKELEELVAELKLQAELKGR